MGKLTFDKNGDIIMHSEICEECSSPVNLNEHYMIKEGKIVNSYGPVSRPFKDIKGFFNVDSSLSPSGVKEYGCPAKFTIVNIKTQKAENVNTKNILQDSDLLDFIDNTISIELSKTAWVSCDPKLDKDGNQIVNPSAALAKDVAYQEIKRDKYVLMKYVRGYYRYKGYKLIEDQNF